MSVLDPVLDEVVASRELLVAERGQGEEGFGMTPAVVERLGSLGVFRLLARDRSVDLGTFMRVVEEVAFADPSVAWAVVNSNGAALVTNVCSDAVAAGMLDESNGFFGVGFPPTGKAERRADGLWVTGRWPVVSGCEHASHFVLNCLIFQDGEMVVNGAVPEVGFAVVPRMAARIERTWTDVMAVKGSGSHAVVVEGCGVESGALATMDQMQASLSVWGRMPGVAYQSISLAAVALGIGRAAVEGAIEQTSTRVSAASGRAWADAPTVQNAVASADIAIEVSREGLFALADRAWAQMTAGEPLDTVTHARLHSIADHAVRTARQTVSDLFATGSVDAVRRGHLLERSLRDIHGFSVQWERYRQLHLLAGEALMGHTIDDPQY